MTWRSADLFSLADAEDALAGADYAVYLVHSMMPSAKLTQAKFEDMDVIWQIILLKQLRKMALNKLSI